MKVRIEPIAEHHAYLLIDIAPEDYLPKYKEELKKIKKNAQLKGFRQGTVPDTMVQKLYGPELKADLLNKLLNKTIENYQKDQDIHFLGDLIDIPNQQQEAFETDKEIEFKFEVGIAPTPDVTKIIADLDLKKDKIIVPQSLIEEEIQRIVKRSSTDIEVEDDIKENDMLMIQAIESDAANLIEHPHETKFNILFDALLHDNFRTAVQGLKVNDAFEFDVNEIEKAATQKDIDKYFLRIDDKVENFVRPGNLYKGTITAVKRQVVPEINEQLFKTLFGEHTEITTEEQFRDHVKLILQQYFDSEAEKLLDIKLVQELVKHSGMNFPDDFLIKWLKQKNEDWANKEGPELEHAYYHFKEGLTWQLIRDRIATEQNPNIEMRDVLDFVIAETKKKYPGIELPEAQWDEIAKKQLNNRENSMHFYTEVLNSKILDWLKSQLTISEVEISLEDFNKKVKEINSHDHHPGAHQHSHEVHEHHDHH